jgi:hypothetical protein
MTNQLIANSEFIQKTGDVQHKLNLVLNTTSISQASIIIDAFDVNDNETHFHNEDYSIFVSNDAYDTIPKDENSYYNIMITEPNPKWIFLRTVSLGEDVRCTQSLDFNNSGTYANPLHWHYKKIEIPEIPNVKCRITCGSR